MSPLQKSFKVSLICLGLILAEPLLMANSSLLTAQDQARGTPQDIEITRSIRAELVKNEHLSISAKNIKIITLDGVITLRGPVHSSAEKREITRIVQDMATNQTIHNELQVKR